MAAVKNKTAIVTGNPNSPLRGGYMQVFTCKYNQSSAGDTIVVGPLKNTDQVLVFENATDNTASYAGIVEDISARTTDIMSGTISLVPVNAAPAAADLPLTVVVYAV